MLVTTAKVVFVPVLAGLIIRRFAKGVAERILPVAPVAAVIAIVLIVGAILGAKRGALLEAGLPLLLAVFTTHALGFAIAFLLAGVLTREVDRFGVVARTVSIEVGMQNTGLGSVLAQSHFANPLTAVPSAISAVFHCILGSALAAYWSRHPSADQARADQTS
jgi:BASS family bile acid:Na+ symporter